MIESSGIRLLDRSGIAEARRIAVQHAAAAGFTDAERSNVAIVTTELATNLLRHAREGVLTITSQRPPSVAVILLLAVDKGPGIADISMSLTDGYSSVGTFGGGLGAVSRLSTTLDVHSTPAGTVLVAELVRGRASTAPRLAGFTLAKEGQDMNGDRWDCRQVDGGFAVLVCDGLGHGAFAGRASSEAVDTFRRAAWRGPKDMLTHIDVALRSTRGAAAAVAYIDASRRRLHYCGVGNVSGCIVSGESSRHLVSHNGILGHTGGRIAEFDYDFGPDSTLVMHSDGMSSRWQPSDFGATWERHPGIVAGLLYRDFARGNDDVAAAVVRP